MLHVHIQLIQRHVHYHSLTATLASYVDFQS
jgi:hypothetical protein